MADPTTAEPTNTGPAIHITNARAGASTFSGSDSRSFNYFTPKGRHASVYEDVTVDVQPDPTRYLLQGWLYAFADGVAGFSETWSKLQSSDWHVFRDPNEQWHRTIYIR
jgi:propane 2-monooxygenase small subunit